MRCLSEKRRVLSVLRDERTLLVGLFLFALGLRFTYVTQIRNSPFSDVPIVDSKTYVDRSMEIARGDWLGEEPFWQPPVYPYLLAVIHRAFGENFYVIRLLQSVIASFSCVLVYLIGRRIFGRSVGLIAALMVSGYGVLIYFDGEFLPTSLAVLLNLVSMLMLLRAVESPGVRRWLLSGIVLGLSAITVANVLVFVPFTIAWIWIVFRNSGERSQGSAVTDGVKRTTWVISFCLGVFMIISVVTVRNYVVGEDLVFISYNAGLNFYIGNNPDYDRTVGIRPGRDWVELTGMPSDEGIEKPSLTSRFFLSKAWTFIRESPADYVRLLLKKLYLFWNGDEIKRNQDIYFSRSYSSLLSVLLWKKGIAFPFGLLGPLALTGILLCLKRWREVFLPLTFVLSYTTSVVLFFICSRYRVPVLPFLALFAAYTLWWWMQRLRAKEYRHLLSALPFLGLTIGANLNVGAMNMEGDADTHYQLCLVYAEKGMYATAAPHCRRTLELEPEHVEARYNLGASYAKRAMYDEAISEYRELIEIAPHRTAVRYNLANIYMKKGMYDEAMRVYETLVQIAPDRAEYHYRLGNCYAQEGMYDEAIVEYGAAVRLNSKHLDARYNLGFLYAETGMYDKAVAEYRSVLESKPDYVDVLNNLGIIFLKKGTPDSAIAQFKRAIEMQPSHIAAHNNLSLAYEQEGRYDEAISEYERVLQIEPRYGEAHHHLARLHYLKGDIDSATDEMEKYDAYTRQIKAAEAIKMSNEALKEILERSAPLSAGKGDSR